jgi:hypothetical protein
VVNSKGNKATRSYDEPEPGIGAGYGETAQPAAEYAQYDQQQGTEYDGYYEGTEYAGAAGYSGEEEYAYAAGTGTGQGEWEGEGNQYQYQFEQEQEQQYGEAYYAGQVEGEHATGEGEMAYDYEAPLEEFELNYSKWCVYESEEGYPYYLEASTQHSQWEDPRTYGMVMPTAYDDPTGEAEDADVVYGQDEDGEVFTRPRRITPKKPTPKKATPKKVTPDRHAEARAKRSKPQRVQVEMTPPRHGPGDLFSSSSDEEDVRAQMGRERRRLPLVQEQEANPLSARNRAPPAKSPLSGKKAKSASDVLHLQGPPVSALSPDSSSAKKKAKMTKKLVIMNVEAALTPRRASSDNVSYDNPQLQIATEESESQSKSAVRLASTLRRSLVDSIQNSPKHSGKAFFDDKPQDVMPPQSKRLFADKPANVHGMDKEVLYDSQDDWDAEEEESEEVDINVVPTRDRWDFSAEKNKMGNKQRPKTASNIADRMAPAPAPSGRGRIFLAEEGTYGSGGNKY